MPLIGTDGHPLSLSLALARSLPLANPNSAQLQLCAATHASLEQRQPEHARTRVPNATLAAPRLDASTDVRSSRAHAWSTQMKSNSSHITHQFDRLATPLPPNFTTHIRHIRHRDADVCPQKCAHPVSSLRAFNQPMSFD